LSIVELCAMRRGKERTQGRIPGFGSLGQWA
jgi:hypothetical protein